MNRERLRNWVRMAIHLLLLRPFIKLYCGVHVKGLAHLRELDRFVMIANHNSHLDVFLLFNLLSARDISITHPVASESYFRRWYPLYAVVRFLVQPVWVRSGQPQERSDPLRGMKDQLDRGHNIILFPEGTRGLPGQMAAFKSGLGRLVSHYPDLPIVPVFLAGPERVLPRNCWIPLPFWSQVTIGPPQTYAGNHHDITRHLQNTLLELSQSRLAQRRPRQRHHRPAGAPAVAVLGIDGSGKSTLARALAERLSTQGATCLVGDHLVFFEHGRLKPLQPLGLEAIRGLVSRYAKRAQSLAAYKTPKLAELILRDRLLAQVNRWYAPKFIVQDGSPLLNMAAWAALYHAEGTSEESLVAAMRVMSGQILGRRERESVFRELPELRRLDRLGLTRLQMPQTLVLLDVAPDVACRRIEARGGPRQPHETEEKLGRLREAYQRVLRIIMTTWRIPARQLDGTAPPERIVLETLEFVQSTLLPTSHHGPSH